MSNPLPPFWTEKFYQNIFDKTHINRMGALEITLLGLLGSAVTL